MPRRGCVLALGLFRFVSSFRSIELTQKSGWQHRAQLRLHLPAHFFWSSHSRAGFFSFLGDTEYTYMPHADHPPYVLVCSCALSPSPKSRGRSRRATQDLRSLHCSPWVLHCQFYFSSRPVLKSSILVCLHVSLFNSEVIKWIVIFNSANCLKFAI